jgi:hypothetical protein
MNQDLKPVIGDKALSEKLIGFWKERGPEDEDDLLLVTAGLMAGKQRLSPVTALTVATSLKNIAPQEFVALQLLANTMLMLKQVGDTLSEKNNPTQAFQADFAEAITGIGERIVRFGKIINKEKGEGEEKY